MASLATILFDKGNSIIGYDNDENYSHTMQGLNERNIKIYYDESYVLDSDVIVVHSSALKDDHKEMKRCKEAGLKMYSYYQMIGILSREHKTICVSGCHGKTSTSSMISHVFGNTIGATFIVGDGTGYLDEKSDLLVLESCEYQRHFLEYDPFISIITNIDLDHIDYFKDIEDVKSAFIKLIQNTRDKVLVCADDAIASELVSEKIVFYGTNQRAFYRAENIIQSENGMIFDYYEGNNFIKTFDLKVYGKHNLQNTLATIAVSRMLNIDLDNITSNLLSFKGAKRRFSEEFINNYVLIDDYAHHPNEVSSMISAAKQKYKDYKITVFFQGHTFSRVEMFYKEFSKILSDVNQTIFVKIAPSREKQEDYPHINASLMKDLVVSSYLEEDYDYNNLITQDKTVILFLSPCSMEKYINKVKEIIK